METFRKGSAILKSWMEESSRVINIIDDQKTTLEQQISNFDAQIAQVQKECDDLEAANAALRSVAIACFA